MMDACEGKIPDEATASQAQGSSHNGSGWPLKNITKRFSSRKNNNHSQLEATDSASEFIPSKQQMTSAVSKKTPRKSTRKAEEPPRPRVGSREQNNGRSTVIKSRLTSASTKLSFCFTAHCITAVESPNNTIESSKPQRPVNESEICWREIVSDVNSCDSNSRSPYECPICFEQYQFDFDTISQSGHDCATSEDSGGDGQACGGKNPLSSFKDHLPRLMQCGHTLCSKCLGKLGEDMRAQVLGFVKCPICRELHYTEPVIDGGEEEYASQSEGNVADVMAEAWSQHANEAAACSSDVNSHKGHQFVFRVNYALLSAIEHNLMHISAEDLAVTYHDSHEGIDDSKMAKTLERNARHRKTYSMYETVSNKVNASAARIGRDGKPEATHVTFEDIQKMLRPELIISQHNLNAIHMSPMDSRAESDRTITASEN